MRNQIRIPLDTKPVPVPADLHARSVRYVFVNDPVALEEASRKVPSQLRGVDYQYHIDKSGDRLFAVYEAA
jgi:hypothetical protein